MLLLAAQTREEVSVGMKSEASFWSLLYFLVLCCALFVYFWGVENFVYISLTGTKLSFL